MRVSTSLCVVEREARRLQCSVARIWMRSAVSDGAASPPVRRRWRGRVIVPCGHHAPAAHRRHSIHSGRMVGCVPCLCRRRPRRPGARPEPRGVRARGRPRDADTAGTDTPVGCAPSGPMSEAVEVSRRLRHRADRHVPGTAVGHRDAAHRRDRGRRHRGAGWRAHPGALHALQRRDRRAVDLDRIRARRRSCRPPSTRTSSCPGLVKTLRCSTVGSRIVGVVPASDGFGDKGNDDLGIAAGQTRRLRARSRRGRADPGRGRLHPAARRLPRGRLGPTTASRP